jgi:hypothetical protein
MGGKHRNTPFFPASKTGITVATYRLTTLILFTAGRAATSRLIEDQN